MVTSYINVTSANTMEEINWNKLLHTTLATPVPFLLPLREQDPPIYCEQIIRSVPKKRLVVFGTWNEQPVVAKIFYDSHAKSHSEYELEGVELLVSCGIPTPRVLLSTPIFKKHAYVLVFEQMTEAENLDEFWRNKADTEEWISVLHALTIELATQHVLGILQKDLHLKNFLLKGNQIYTLDGGTIDSFGELLPKKESLDHLALLFSQLGVGTEELQHALFQTYTQARGWIVKRSETQFLYKAVKKCNMKRKKDYQKKIRRNCSAFAKKTRFLSTAMYDREHYSADLLKFLTHPETAFSHPGLEILKAGRSATIIKTQMADKTYVIKRYNMKNIWHWLRRTLRSTRAAESWRLANTLRLFGIATPKPIAFVEKRFLGLRSTSYLIMEYVDGPNLLQYFAHYQANDPRYEKVAERVMTLLKNIAKMQMSHGDLKATNILIENDQPLLIDLDGMKEYKKQSKANRIYKQEMKRFMQNWEAQPTVKALFEKFL